MAVGGPSFSDATGVPKAIPDNNPAGCEFHVHLPGTMERSPDLDVKIGQLTHSFVGDLKITLSHGATTVVLMNRPGQEPSAPGGNDFVDLILDDEASRAYREHSGGQSPGGYTGSYTPDELLSP